jgi:rRNA pseudouridine-1189 N-methylase Emg1 (Nep1/Mra1 family)
MLSNLFNKRKREIERLNRVIISLELLKATVEMNLRKEIAKNALLLHEKDDLINLIKDYETQIKILNITIGDFSRTDNNSRYY